MTNPELQLEVCASGIESALAAQEAGVDRIELCDKLEVGGITPLYDTIKQTNYAVHIQTNVLIRPRDGDFIYSEEEFQTMLNDARFCAGSFRTTGIVFGILKQDGSIDEDRCRELIEIISPLRVTFHRAFDVVKDPFIALEQLITLGFDCILTSGQKSNCLEGAEMISQLVKQAAGRISIMAGGGITEENIAEVVKRSDTNEFHFSAKKKLADGSFVSDLNRIRKIKEIAEKTFYGIER